MWLRPCDRSRGLPGDGWSLRARAIRSLGTEHIHLGAEKRPGIQPVEKKLDWGVIMPSRV